MPTDSTNPQDERHEDEQPIDAAVIHTDDEEN